MWVWVCGCCHDTIVKVEGLWQGRERYVKVEQIAECAVLKEKLRAQMCGPMIRRLVSRSNSGQPAGGARVCG